MRFGIGQPVTRKEDARFLTGRGCYVADIDLVRQSCAVFLFSPHAHARIRAVDKSAAEQMPGVLAVLTGEDWAADGLGTLDPEMMVEDMGGPQGYRTKRPPLAQGRVRYVGERVAVVIAATEEIVDLGITLVPEGRRLFPKLTVEENLLLGAFRALARAEIARNLDVSYETFPVLLERRRQLAGSLSGGEQQMLSLARALMSAPKILLIDEPSVGLAPVLVKRTIEKIKELKERHQLTVLMAEQNFNQAVRIADRGYVIVHGKIAFEGGSADELNNNELVRKFYLGL